MEHPAVGIEHDAVGLHRERERKILSPEAVPDTQRRVAGSRIDADPQGHRVHRPARILLLNDAERERRFPQKNDAA